MRQLTTVEMQRNRLLGETGRVRKLASEVGRAVETRVAKTPVGGVYPPREGREPVDVSGARAVGPGPLLRTSCPRQRADDQLKEPHLRGERTDGRSREASVCNGNKLVSLRFYGSVHSRLVIQMLFYAARQRYILPADSGLSDGSTRRICRHTDGTQTDRLVKDQRRLFGATIIVL